MQLVVTMFSCLSFMNQRFCLCCIFPSWLQAFRNPSDLRWLNMDSRIYILDSDSGICRYFVECRRGIKYSTTHGEITLFLSCCWWILAIPTMNYQMTQRTGGCHLHTVQDQIWKHTAKMLKSMHHRQTSTTVLESTQLLASLNNQLNLKSTSFRYSWHTTYHIMQFNWRKGVESTGKADYTHPPSHTHTLGFFLPHMWRTHSKNTNFGLFPSRVSWAIYTCFYFQS